MSNRRRNQAQASPARRRFAPSLKLVPPSVVSAAEQSVSNIRPSLLRGPDLPPALALLVGAVILALVCFIYLTQVTSVSNANFTLQSLESKHTELLRERQDLQLQIGRAQSLPNIEKIAREKLQMVPVGDHYTYIAVSGGPLGAVPPLPTPALLTPTPSDEP
jgi:cell division protein FtsL